MARINTAPPTTPESKPLTHEGAAAVRVGTYNQLRRSVLACLLWEDTFYESGEQIADRITGLVPHVAPEAAMQLAVDARGPYKLRHAPLWIARAMAKGPADMRRLVGQTLEQIVQRPDELTEFLALYWKGQKADARDSLSAQVKLGLARAFTKFTAYQLAKYNRADAVKLRDVLFLCHAKPNSEYQAQLWKRLIGGYCEVCWGVEKSDVHTLPNIVDAGPYHKFVEAKLPTPDTWEVVLSAAEPGQEVSPEQKLERWSRLLVENKLGALALLRNLRNMLQAGVHEVALAGALARMKVERVLPYRFIAAARHAPQLEPALELAMLRSLEGADKLPGRTVLLVDVSGSMDAPLSAKSDLSRMDAACGLAMLLREVCTDVVVVTFSNSAVRVPARRGFALRDAIFSSQQHGGTYTQAGKDAADALGYDRLIIITDEQSHTGLTPPARWEVRNGIRVPTDSKPMGYVINVGANKNGIGYGAWTHIDGFSEAVVHYIQEVEKTA